MIDRARVEAAAKALLGPSWEGSAEQHAAAPKAWENAVWQAERVLAAADAAGEDRPRCSCDHEESDGRADVLRCPVHGIGSGGGVESSREDPAYWRAYAARLESKMEAAEARVVELEEALRETIEAARDFNRGGMTWREFDALLARMAALAAAGEGEAPEGYVSCVCGESYEAHEVRNGYCPTRGPLAKYEPDLSGSRLPEQENN